MRKILCFLLCLYAPSALLSSPENPKVVVIGAGFAGLTAAYRLRQKGMDVEVYEARPRVGGRVFSVRILDEVGELGGRNIRDGGKAEHLLALAHELHLETVGSKSSLRFPYIDEQGLHDFHALLQERHFDANELSQKLQEKAKSAHNMEELLLTLFKRDEVLYKACDAMLHGYEGAPAAQLSPLCVSTLYNILLGGLCAVHPNTGEREMEGLAIRGGNGRLAEALAQNLFPNVHLGEPLSKISKTQEGGYRLTFKSGKQVICDRLILTVPCPVYKDLRIEETVIPKERQEAIRALPYARTSKILVPVQPSLKRNGALSDSVSIWSTLTTPILTLYYFDAQGLSQPEALHERFEKTLPLIEMLYGKLYPNNLKNWEFDKEAPQNFDSERAIIAERQGASENQNCEVRPTPPKTNSSSCLGINTNLPVHAQAASFASYTGAVSHCWPDDPFSQGSYSYIPAGHEESYACMIEFENEMVKALFAPIDYTLFFAGEHTCIDLDICGTMEAAVESGERTARLVMRSKDKKIIEQYPSISRKL